MDDLFGTAQHKSQLPRRSVQDSPERNEEDAVDDVELFQDAGHAGGCELWGGREDEPRVVRGVGGRGRGDTHLERRDVGAGAVAVDLVHGALQGHGLLGQALEVLGALLGLLVVLAQLWGRPIGKRPSASP